MVGLLIAPFVGIIATVEDKERVIGLGQGQGFFKYTVVIPAVTEHDERKISR